jgi:SAM-dependent methyltransferase
MTTDPIDPCTDETVPFLTAGLAPRARILEAGCGAGHVAARLVALGFAVVAVDASEEAVVAARARGVDARLDDFTREGDLGEFDAVAFTRSLHHMDPLARALERARASLHPGGLLLLEEFDVDAPDDETARWLFETQSLLRAAGLVEEHGHAAEGEGLERWRAHHAAHGPIHSRARLTEAVERRFAIERVTTEPYLYRYLAHHMEKSERGVAAIRETLAVERARIARGVTKAVGLRVVARAR